MIIVSEMLIVRYFDMVSMIMVLVFTIPMLYVTGLFRDFLRAFPAAVSKNREYTITELKKSLLALHMVIKSVWYTSIFWTVATFIYILSRLDTPETLGPNVSVALIVILYAAGINIILLIFHTRLKARMIETEQNKKENAGKEEKDKNKDKDKKKKKSTEKEL